VNIGYPAYTVVGNRVGGQTNRSPSLSLLLELNAKRAELVAIILGAARQVGHLRAMFYLWSIALYRPAESNPTLLPLAFLPLPPSWQPCMLAGLDMSSAAARTSAAGNCAGSRPKWTRSRKSLTHVEKFVKMP